MIDTNIKKDHIIDKIIGDLFGNYINDKTF